MENIQAIYPAIYQLFLTHIYGVEAAALTPDQSLVLVFVSTLACLFLIALPFLLVWRVIRIFF